MASNPDENLGRKGRALTIASRIAAAGSGTYLAMLLGPAGAAAAVGALSELGDALVGKLIDWESRRVNRMLIGVKSQIDERVSSGDEIREELSNPDNPGAQAVFESVVEAAARSIEEKKCDLIANFYASVAFDRTIAVDDALLYLRRIRASSWRQLVALRYVEDKSRTRERELIGAAGAEGDASIHPALGIELSELAGRGLELIGIGQDDGSVSDPSSVFGGGTITSQTVVRLRATELGESISRLGHLADLVTNEELDTIAIDLRSSTRPTA
jgi:hypothetical protein